MQRWWFWVALLGTCTLLIALVLVIALRTTDTVTTPPAPSAGVTTTASEAAAPMQWPPPLPPGVPTTGEHTWRVTWTPDPDAEQQYLADLSGTDSGSSTWGPGYVPANADRLIGMGYEICEDYYRGVAGADMSDHLVLPGAGLPGPTEVDRLHQAFEIEVAARANFCLNIDPWGQSY